MTSMKIWLSPRTPITDSVTDLLEECNKRINSNEKGRKYEAEQVLDALTGNESIGKGEE